MRGASGLTLAPLSPFKVPDIYVALRLKGNIQTFT